MKYTTLKAVSSALLLSGNLLVAPVSIAATAEATPMTSIPATIEGIWHAIDAKSAELKNTITAGKLDEVHHQAFAIRDLVAALPARSSSLPAEKLAKVQGGVKFVATLAERLDATGDANDVAGTKQNYDKLIALLESMRSRYTPAP